MLFSVVLTCCSLRKVHLTSRFNYCCLCIILEVLTGVKRTYVVFYLCGIGLCKSMHSYDAIIDLADRDTSKQDKPCAGWRVTMSYRELLICKLGCNPVCNTGAPGRFCQEVSRVIMIGCQLRRTGSSAEGGLHAVNVC